MEGNPYTQATINSLIDDLGRFDVRKRDDPIASEPLTEQRLVAFDTLSELGDQAMPDILARLKLLPELERELMAAARSTENNQQLSWLLGQKNDLIQLVSRSGNPAYGQHLLELANTEVGAGVTDQAALVLALRRLGAENEEQIMLRRLFKGPDNYQTGAGALLAQLLTQRNEKDQALAKRVATWPLESRLKGRAVLLGTRLGLKDEMLSEIKSTLAGDLPAEIRNASYEVGLFLTALAELLPPDQYLAASSDAQLLQNKGFRSVINAGKLHNAFWWANDAQKEALVFQLVEQQQCDNDILVLHYLLKNKRTDLLNQTGQIHVKNAGQRLSNPDLAPQYGVNQINAHRIQAAGYRLSAVDGDLVIEKIPGYGMFD